MMTEEQLFHSVQLVVETVGFGALVFKIGRYIGVAETNFAALFENQKELKAEQEKHQVDDDIRHEKIMETLTDIRMSVARIKK